MIFDTRVSEVLAFKGSRHVWTLSGRARVHEAVTLMQEHGIGSVVVADDDEVVGVVTERECLAHLDSDGNLSPVTQLRSVARVDFPVISLKTTARECFALMAAFRARYLPVVEEGELVGLVSIGDIVRALVDDQRFTIQQLMVYITGSHVGIGNDLDIPSTAPTMSDTRVSVKAANG